MVNYITRKFFIAKKFEFNSLLIQGSGAVGVAEQLELPQAAGPGRGGSGFI